MAIHGKVITNAQTRQSIRFIKTSRDTHGQLLEMESVYLAQSKEPASHYHPRQEEDFLVLEGELTVAINGQVKKLKTGDVLHIPAGTHHAMWNNSNMNTIVNWRVRPALNTEYMLETIYGLASDGKTNQQGMPGIWQIAITANQFGNEFRLSKPPFAVQKIIFGLLSPIAYLFGYRAIYKRYID
jgi:quercetin dioxygenase-like cupin family protein